MGLESINLFFHCEEPLEDKLIINNMFVYEKSKKYIYKMDQKYWIDIQMLDSYTISLRIMLSNPTTYLFEALDKLFLLLFKLDSPELKNMITKEVYYKYDYITRERIEKSFLEKKILFKSMYGEFTAAIGTDEFYEKYSHQ